MENIETKTLKKNDELVLTVDSLGANGEGVCHYAGKVVFVPFALVGEEVLVHIIYDKKSFYVGKLIRVITPSKDRATPLCPYFSKCGGCDLQHLKYEETLKLKKQIVSDALYKYAGITVNVKDTVPSDKDYRYRNKFSFPVSEDKFGNPVIGMYKKNSHEIVEIEDCFLQSENAKTIIKLFKEYMIENKISAYNEETKKGIIKHIVVRESGNEFILTVVVTDKNFNNFEPLISKLSQKFKSFGIFKNVNNLKNNVIFGNLDIFVHGIKSLQKEEFGILYEFNNRSFLQVNNYIKNEIYKKIIETISESENIIDAYSGAGLLSGILATKAKNVYGVEIVKEATADAEKLKQKNNLKNLTNINGDCSVVVPELAKKLGSNFLVVVDPPRKGLDEKVAHAILNSQPKQIIYLSCNPATLARDLKIFIAKYDIDFVQSYDMFPQTANVETLVCLKLKEEK